MNGPEDVSEISGVLKYFPVSLEDFHRDIIRCNPSNKKSNESENPECEGKIGNHIDKAVASWEKLKSCNDAVTKKKVERGNAERTSQGDAKSAKSGDGAYNEWDDGLEFKANRFPFSNQVRARDRAEEFAFGGEKREGLHKKNESKEPSPDHREPYIHFC